MRNNAENLKVMLVSATHIDVKTWIKKVAVTLDTEDFNSQPIPIKKTYKRSIFTLKTCVFFLAASFSVHGGVDLLSWQPETATTWEPNLNSTQGRGDSNLKLLHKGLLWSRYPYPTVIL